MLLQPRPYFVSQKGSLDTVNPVRTDITCLQLRWMMGQIFRRRVLKRRKDFSDSVPLKCKRNTLMNSHVRTRTSTRVQSGTGKHDFRGSNTAWTLVQSRKGLIGMFLISVCQADEWTVWKTAPRCRRAAGKSDHPSVRKRLKVKPHTFFILCYPWCSFQHELVDKELACLFLFIFSAKLIAVDDLLSSDGFVCLVHPFDVRGMNKCIPNEAFWHSWAAWAQQDQWLYLEMTLHKQHIITKNTNRIFRNVCQIQYSD